MIQHSWLNNIHFGGRYDETDPISHFGDGNDGMTIQRRWANPRIVGMPQFVTVRGGACFFLPGIEAPESVAYDGELDTALAAFNGWGLGPRCD